MGQISSINFKKTNAIQTRHNDRDLAPNYLLKSGGLGVEYNRNHKEALELRNRIISDAMIKYQEFVKQPFKAKSYEWSAVCNIKESTTMQDLETLSDYFEKEFGFQCYQIVIHRDEGYIDENGKEQINHHAHLEFVTLDKETGKNRYRREYITPQTLRQIQDKVAEILQMQRGEDKRKTCVKRIEPRLLGHQKELEKQAIKEATNELQEKLNYAIDLLAKNGILLEQEAKKLKEEKEREEQEKYKEEELEELKKEKLQEAENLRKEMIGQDFEKEEFRKVGTIKKMIKNAGYKNIKDAIEGLEFYRKRVIELMEARNKQDKTIQEKDKEIKELKEQNKNKDDEIEHLKKQKEVKIIPLSEYKRQVREQEIKPAPVFSPESQNQNSNIDEPLATLATIKQMQKEWKAFRQRNVIESEISVENQKTIQEHQINKNDLKPDSVNLSANNQIVENQKEQTQESKQESKTIQKHQAKSKKSGRGGR